MFSSDYRCLSRARRFPAPVNPSSNQHQRSASSDDLEQCQRLVRLVRLRNQRQGNRQRRGQESNGRDQLRHGCSSRYANHVRPRRFALQLDHGREQIQIRNEIGDHAHADQNVVGAFHAGARLPQKDENDAEDELRQQRDPWRLPARMQALRTPAAESDLARRRTAAAPPPPDKLRPRQCC